MDYYTLVFENIENPNPPFGCSYIMVTVFPNWQSRIPEIGDEGFLMYDEVQGGIDEYYDIATEKIMKYNFSNLIFKKFVKEKTVDTSKNVIL